MKKRLLRKEEKKKETNVAGLRERKKENSSVEETITLMGVFNDRWKTKIKYES